MLVPVLLFALGLVLLIKGGDWFVDGATGLARRFHIPEIIVGATVVSIGTTLPEVMVSATGALNGQGAMSYGNAIGSIICNTSLIAAITLAVRPAPVDVQSMKKPVIFFFVAAAVYCFAAYGMGEFTRPLGIVLLAMFVFYMVVTVRQGIKTPAPQDEEPHEDGTSVPLWKELLLLVVGAAVIAVGANLLVDNGTIIAKELGVPETVIALTFVALGTSLPELVTAITSLVKGHGSLSIGNIAYYAMWLRRYMVDESNKDYIRLARAKGVPNGKISFRHVFRNAFVPLVQYIPNSILFTLMGSLYVESLYSVPGMGGLLVTAIKRQDNTLVQALVLIYAVISILGLLFGDILMGIVDPRISFAKKEGSR